MTRRIVVRRLAERDIIDAEDWYDAQRLGLGLEFREVLTDLLGRLAETPQLYPCIHGDVRRAVLRRFPYVVYYVIEGPSVVILACLDSRRDPRLHRARARS